MNCICDSVRLSLSLCLELSSSDLVDNLHDRCSACIDPEVKRSKVKRTGISDALPAWDCTSVT